MDLNGNLGLAKPLVESKIKEVDGKVNQLDKYRKLYKGWKGTEERDSIYLIFRKTNPDSHPSSLYVGKTRQDIYQRLTGHYNEVLKRLREEKEWDIKHRWLYQLVRDNELEIILLNKVQRSEVYSFEKEWIEYLRRCDFKMMNKDNSHKIKHKIGTA